MTLAEAQTGGTYKVVALHTGDHEMDAFLFTLGCYAGEEVTVVSIVSGSQTIAVRDGRYSIDKNLSKAIEVEQVSNGAVSEGGNLSETVKAEEISQ